MICPREGEAYVFLRVVHTTREVVEVEINCTKVVEMDPIIAFRSNWSCQIQRVRFKFGSQIIHGCEF